MCKELQQSHAMIRQQIEATESLAKEQAQWHRYTHSTTQHNISDDPFLIPPNTLISIIISSSSSGSSISIIILWLTSSLYSIV